MFSLITLVFFFPFTVIITFYSCLLGNVKRFYRQIGIRDGQHKTNIHNIAKMVILVLVTTIICWLPLVTYWIQRYEPASQEPYTDNSLFMRTEARSTWFFWGEFLVFVYSALQPCIYFLTGTKLRKVQQS